ncbi:MAG: response regulator [Verrucomicrobiales bacterium]|nr:response regulator [Verrucomicrobiales bacterium]
MNAASKSQGRWPEGKWAPGLGRSIIDTSHRARGPGPEYRAASSRGRVWYGWVATVLLLAVGAAAAGADSIVRRPEERTDQTWRLHQLTADAGLEGRNAFNIAFQRDATNAAIYRVWVASSDGLREYDGFEWRRYGTGDGLPSDFVRCVCVTRQSELWVGTDRGVGVFAGGRFDSRNSESGLAGPNVRRIYEDSQGAVWFCSDSWPHDHQRGGLSSYSAGRWRAFRRADGLPNEYVVGYLRATDGQEYAATLAGLVERRGERWQPATVTLPEDPVRWSGTCLLEAPTYGVLCSTGRDLLQRTNGVWSVLVGGSATEHGLCLTADGVVVSTTRVLSGSRAFVELVTNTWVIASSDFGASHDYIEDLQEAPDGSVWAVGFDTIVRWRRQGTQWREFGGVPRPSFVDEQGRIWFGEPRNEFGVAPTPVRLDGERWEYLAEAEDELMLDRRGTVWGVSSNRVTHWSANREERWSAGELGMQHLLAGRPDDAGRFWVFGRGSDGTTGLRVGRDGRWQDRPIPELREWPVLRKISGAREGAWLLLENPERPMAVMARVTDASLQRVEIPRTNLGLFRLDLKEDRDGVLWVYGDSGTWRLEDWSREGWKEVTGLPGRLVFGFEERGEERWLGCSGATGGTNGLVKWAQGRQTFYAVETLFNLSIAADGTLLAGGPAKFALVPNEPDAEPMTFSVPTPELVIGAVRDHRGRYWLGTGERVYSFTPDGVAPDTRFAEISSTNVFEGTDWSVGVAGIERYLPSGFLKDYRFSWRIDESAWSPFRQGDRLRIVSRHLESGLHRLEVRCQDAAMEVDPTPAVLSFRVIPIPIQSRRWFVPGIVLVAAAFGVVSIVAWRARQGISAYARLLESKVADRTAELERDIEERKLTEARLRESERRYGDLVRLSPDAIFINQGDRITFINNAGLQLLRASAPEQVIGRAVFEFFDPACHELIRHRVGQLRREPTSVAPVEEELLAVDGTHIPVEVTASSYFSQGELVIQVVCRDITARKRAEAEQKVMAAQLHQAQKLEAVGTLAGGIAHDFNNILGAILGNLELARMDVGERHAAIESLDEIGRAAHRARALVQQILAFSRPNAPEQKATDLAPVIRETLRFLRATLPSGVELQLGLDARAPSVLADATQISQVVVNLCTNAWHALENRPGIIEVHLEGIEVGSGNVPPSDGLPAGKYAKLSVGDNGSGMDASTLERVFEPFFTTKEPGKGTGLGLAVVHGIVQAHRGFIQVRSTPGKGTRFDVYLPVAPGMPQALPKSPEPAIHGKGRRILYVDDEAALVRQMVRILSRMGFTVEAHDRVEPALNRFCEDPDLFDLVITDMNMPGASGLDLAAEVLRLRPQASVLLTSGLVSEEVKETARKLGVRRILPKPCTTGELGQAIVEALAAPPGPSGS